jgi:hypothetical protein
MKAFFASVLLVASVIGLTSAGGAADSPDRPPGLAAADWVPISDSLGIVLLHHDRMTIDIGQAVPATDGYFMVKGHTGWRRLAIVRPFAGRFQPTGT